MRQRLKDYFWLLRVNLFISAFTFGGGYIIIPMIRRFFVQKKQLFTEEEFLDMAAVAQSTPGAIAVNLSALAGFHVAGVPGVLISCVAAVTPPLIILGVISAFYAVFTSNPMIAAVLKGMEAGVAALMVDVIIDMCSAIWKKRSVFLSAMIPASFLANFIFDINVIFILLACCFLCVAKAFWDGRKTK